MFILLSWVKYYTKELAKALKIISIGVLLIGTVIVLKFKPVYEVKLADKPLGFVKNKDKIELNLSKYRNQTGDSIAFREQLVTPEYELKFISRKTKTQERDVLIAAKEQMVTTYRFYAVTVDGQIKATVKTEDEAKELVTEIKSDINQEIGTSFGIVEQYTTDTNATQPMEEANNVLKTIKVAKIIEYNTAQEEKRKAAEAEAKKKIISGKTVQSVGTIAGFSLTRPVEGSITSRFGSRSSIRSGAHTGLDIATASGTPVHPIAPGTVSFAGYKGSYGNLVIISHGNGVETYYAHCSVIYSQVGEYVDSSSVISAVGSTGNSTGPHLHLEIRENGNILNPEEYLY